MSWIQENKFVAMLGGATVLGAVVIGYLGMTYRTKYTQAHQEYQDAATQVEEFEQLPLYPTDENRAGKRKSLNAYRTEITSLQAVFEKYRPKELVNVPPQTFADQAKAARDEVTKAFEEKKTALPAEFFLGFEGYTATLASEEATGALSYQLGAIKEMLLSLAQTGPSQLQNLHRPKLVEEEGAKYTPGETDTARAFPVEVTFKTTKKGLRAFLTSLASSQTHYYTIRTIRAINEKHGKAPNKNDAKFDIPAPAGGVKPAAPGGDPFGGFVLPDDPPAKPATPAPAPAPGAGTPPAKPATPAPAPAPATPAAPAPAPAPKPAGTPGPAGTSGAPGAPAPAGGKADSSRILQQVLGDEEIQVFIRLDVMRFLPTRELPAVPK